MGGKVWRVQAPRAFSVNSMFANRPGKGRAKTQAYRQWRQHCEGIIMTQGVRPCYTVPVAILLEFGSAGVSADFDVDNGIKGIIDVLVRMGVLPDDRHRFVPVLLVAWRATMEGTQITVAEMEGTAVPSAILEGLTGG